MLALISLLDNPKYVYAYVPIKHLHFVTKFLLRSEVKENELGTQ